MKKPELSQINTPQRNASPIPTRHELAVSYGVARLGLPSAAGFREWMTLALGPRKRPAIIALRVVDAVLAQQLNQQFRGRDYATNVLSFPADLPTPRGSPDVLGDLAICAPVVLREAVEQGKSARAHFAHLTIHGVLHLLGHDHIDDAQAEKMETLERRLLARLGIADPYRDG